MRWSGSSRSGFMSLCDASCIKHAEGLCTRWTSMRPGAICGSERFNPPFGVLNRFPFRYMAQQPSPLCSLGQTFPYPAQTLSALERPRASRTPNGSARTRPHKRPAGKCMPVQSPDFLVELTRAPRDGQRPHARAPIHLACSTTGEESLSARHVGGCLRA